MTRTRFQAHLVPSAAGNFTKSILSATFCVATAICVQAQDQQQSSGDESWTATKDNAANFNPLRTTESHSKSGNRTVDKQRLEARGLNGSYQPLSETETETIQVNDTTTRTVVRTYQWAGNGQKTLASVTEEESRTNAGGDAHVERKTSSADVNGHFQVVRREIADTKKISPNVEETKRTVYQSDGYGGLAQAEQTQELKTQVADDSVAVKKTTLTPDANGKWRVSGVTEKTIKDDGKNRITEERVSGPDLEGRLQESSRTVSKEAETATGEKKSTVESYSVSAPGYSDGGMHLDRRVTTVQKKDSAGETTEQQVDQTNPANPSDGAKATGRTKYVVKYAGPGTQQTTQQSKTVEIRDVNGNFQVVSAETQKSTQPPPQQTQPPPKPKSDAPADKPPDKPSDKPSDKPPVKP
jgi:hypothetical protein